MRLKKQIKEKNSETTSKTNKIITIILLVLLALVIMVLTIGIKVTNNSKEEIAGITEKEILGDLESIGTNVGAEFDMMSGEITISSISGIGTINIEALTRFFYEIENELCVDIETITFANQVYAPANSSYLFTASKDDDFSKLKRLTTINNFNNLNITNVTNMEGMFSGCWSLSSIDVSNWNTANVTNMSSMFYECSALKSINVNNWNTANVTDMSFMFSGCSSLTSINMSNWDTSKVTNTIMMLNACNTLTDIYTPKAYSTQTISLPSNDWYNITNTSDNNIYSNFKNGNFTGSVHLGKLVNYNISYNLNGGNQTENPATYNAVSNFTLNNPTKEGYRFIGWTGSNGTTPQTTVSITPRALTGPLSYAANYELNKNTLTINPNNGKWNNNIEVSTFELAPNDTKTIENPLRTGYTFNGWNILGEGSTIEGTTFTMGSVDTTLTADWTPNTNTPYTVKHWQQKLTGADNIHDDINYTLIDVDNTLTGTTDTKVKPQRKNYTGFTAPSETEVTINGDGTTTVNYYYTRNSYQLTINKANGILNVTGANTYKYGQTIIISAELKENTPQYTYGWEKWTVNTPFEQNGNTVSEILEQDHTFQMPAKDVTLTANGTETINTYLQTVKVRYENGDGSFTEYENVINQNYNYGEEISWNLEETDIYQTASIEPYTVTEAKTTEVTIYRKSYTITLNKGTGIENVSVGAGLASARRK